MVKKQSTKRPTEYTEAVALEVCRRIALKYTIPEIVRDETMPTKETINMWRAEYPIFNRHYVIALQDVAESYIEDMNDVLKELKEGQIDHQTARVILDTLRWLASKYYPEMFGTKVIDQHVSMDINKKSALSETDEEILRRFGFINSIRDTNEIIGTHS